MVLGQPSDDALQYRGLRWKGAGEKYQLNWWCIVWWIDNCWGFLRNGIYNFLLQTITTNCEVITRWHDVFLAWNPEEWVMHLIQDDYQIFLVVLISVGSFENGNIDHFKYLLSAAILPTFKYPSQVRERDSQPTSVGFCLVSRCHPSQSRWF